MLKPACFALSVGALMFGFGGQVAQAGWSDAVSGLTLSTSSLVISIKKNKNHKDHDDNDDNDNHHYGKQKKKNDHGKSKKNNDDVGQSQGNGNGSSSGIKPVEVPSGTILLPYFECDLNSPGGCSQLKEKN